MTEQNFANHRRYVTGYHILLSLLLITGTVASIINVVRHPANSGGYISSALIALLFICALISFWYNRRFPLKAQDRAIRAEESLRYFILTGKSLNKNLSVGQIAALRFASDDEFVALTAKAVAENLSPDNIKKLIQNWRSDTHRV